MPTKPVVRASPVSHGLFYGLTVDPLEDTTVPSSPVALPVTTSSFSAKKTPFSYAASILHDVFIENNTDFDRAQALYKVFIEMASGLETTSHFYADAKLNPVPNIVTGHIVNPVPSNTLHLACYLMPNPVPSNTQHHALYHMQNLAFCPTSSLPQNHAPSHIMNHAPFHITNHAPFHITNHAKSCISTLAPSHMLSLARSHTTNLANLHTRKNARSITFRLNPKEEHISHSPTLTPMDVVPTDTALPLIASLPTASPTLPDDQIKRKQLKRKQFKQRKLIKKMTRYHENEVLDCSHNNSDYELDSDGFCRDPLAKQDFAHMKREFDKEDDEKYEDTLRAFMDIAEDSDFLADKPPPQNGPKFVVYPSTKKTPARQESSIPPAASPSASRSCYVHVVHFLLRTIYFCLSLLLCNLYLLTLNHHHLCPPLSPSPVTSKLLPETVHPASPYTLQSSTNPHSVATRLPRRRQGIDDLRALAAYQAADYQQQLQTTGRLVFRETHRHEGDIRRQAQVFNLPNERLRHLFRKFQIAEYTHTRLQQFSTLPSPPSPNPPPTTNQRVVRFVSQTPPSWRTTERHTLEEKRTSSLSTQSSETSGPHTSSGYRIQPTTNKGTAPRPFVINHPEWDLWKDFCKSLDPPQEPNKTALFTEEDLEQWEAYKHSRRRRLTPIDTETTPEDPQVAELTKSYAKLSAHDEPQTKLPATMSGSVLRENENNKLFRKVVAEPDNFDGNKRKFHTLVAAIRYHNSGAIATDLLC
ncbi:hypothetical protein JOM56_013171 [Amanita muscaria]